MENTPQSQQDKKILVYSIDAIVWASIFGGPLAGCYLISRNFKSFQKPAQAGRSFLTGVGIAILFLTVLLFLPDKIFNVFSIVFSPFLTAIVTYYYVSRYQKESINDHLKSGGKKYSGWKVMGIIILSVLIYIIALIAGDWITESINKKILSRNNENFYVWLNTPVVNKDKKGNNYYYDMNAIIKTKSVDKCLQIIEEKSYQNYPAGCDGGSAINKETGLTFDKLYESRFNRRPGEMPYIYCKYPPSMDEGIGFSKDNPRTFLLFLDEFAGILKSGGAKDLEVIYPVAKP